MAFSDATFARELPTLSQCYGAVKTARCLHGHLCLALRSRALQEQLRPADDYAADQRFFFKDKISSLNKRNMMLQKKYNRLKIVDS